MSSTAEKKRRFIRLSGKFYYKSGQWSADFITVVRVHKPSSCPTDYTFCFSYRFLGVFIMRSNKKTETFELNQSEEPVFNAFLLGIPFI